MHELPLVTLDSNTTDAHGLDPDCVHGMRDTRVPRVRQASVRDRPDRPADRWRQPAGRLGRMEGQAAALQEPVRRRRLRPVCAHRRAPRLWRTRVRAGHDQVRASIAHGTITHAHVPHNPLSADRSSHARVRFTEIRRTPGGRSSSSRASTRTRSGCSFRCRYPRSPSKAGRSTIPRPLPRAHIPSPSVRTASTLGVARRTPLQAENAHSLARCAKADTSQAFANVARM
jgi:hypothetical protein